MRDRIAENAEPNGRIDIARYLGPLLKVGQCVALGSWVGFHFRGDIERSTDILSLGWRASCLPNLFRPGETPGCPTGTMPVLH